ncbi:hypothetical protein [Acinetobacter chinensis]|uniref:hypothetical protein n=1 Tax=Acinetobacter chinensis TaxID=2004650 RepID=UPI0029348019|nr:hypothetical protein [Acinetobacter chinensis]WOE43207.1 hypothetical protein QSG87_03055 [Acinetobacter chinensis]
MKYSRKTIANALLLAPLPLILLSALSIMIVNSEYRLDSVFVIFAGHALVYLAYCVLTVPFTFLISIGLNHYSALNFFTICISSLVISTVFFILVIWSHTGQISGYWEEVFNHGFTIITALISGFFYWLFLTVLRNRSTENNEQKV